MLNRAILHWRKPLLIHRHRYTFFDFLKPPTYDANKNYYEILEVNEEASDADLKKAFYRLARNYHPDHNQGHQAKFKEINEAYEILSDAKQRKKYDSDRNFFSESEVLSAEDWKQKFESMSPEDQQRAGRKARKQLGKILLGFGIFAYLTYSFFAYIYRAIRGPKPEQKPDEQPQQPQPSSQPNIPKINEVEVQTDLQQASQIVQQSQSESVNSLSSQQPTAKRQNFEKEQAEQKQGISSQKFSNQKNNLNSQQIIQKANQNAKATPTIEFQQNQQPTANKQKTKNSDKPVQTA